MNKTPTKSETTVEEKKVESMKSLIEAMQLDAEEIGDLHNEHCPCVMEDPDSCDCENMRAIKYFGEKWMKRVNEYWIEMAEAHRPYCRPEGNKMLTRMMGKKNRLSSQDK